ncbi:MAG TPA: hypothetical protein GX710_01870 [Clostridiales bacterium]|nr:hypothetical protein [Clostridiales bacterium]
MNKVVKVILKVLGVLVGLGAVSTAVVFIFFPGLPTYIDCKKTFTTLEEPIKTFEEYSVKLSGDTQIHNDGTFSALVPAEWSYKKFDFSSSIDVPGGKYTAPNDSESVLILSSEVPYERILSSDYDDIYFTKSDFESYIKSLGYDVPKENMELTDIALSLTWDDFNIRSKSDAQVFKALATIKTAPPPMGGEAIYYETAEVRGFDLITDRDNGRYDANLYSVKDPLQNISIMGTFSDVNTFYGIVNSITVN